MHITGTHFNYYHICHRKLWLFANSIQMEHTSDLVFEGKLIHENSYPQRSSKYEEVQIGGIKVDYYDAKNGVIHELKKSDKKEGAHAWQLKYYIYVFEQNGINGVSGILEYPKMRKTEEVYLSDIDREYIKEVMNNIAIIIHAEDCPEKIKVSKCRNCSYFDFCYADESEN
ncbi:MAG: CRISPR-associated protein Cas4 [Salinivirgaceae bacterium]|jgi:CRISPR-associated exonuclease Cas4|nr:CRISPR-associated protein Cas4 [Salinivirgaceae bacterium]